uniref:Uncharacterized protein n=1 Tax=Scytodes thoracica TaxID=1112478 RepID=A0A0A0V6P3_SCYTH|nr:hypothetical protein [Scytodes thoracica]
MDRYFSLAVLLFAAVVASNSDNVCGPKREKCNENQCCLAVGKVKGSAGDAPNDIANMNRQLNSPFFLSFLNPDLSIANGFNLVEKCFDKQKEGESCGDDVPGCGCADDLKCVFPESSSTNSGGTCVRE